MTSELAGARILVRGAGRSGADGADGVAGEDPRLDPHLRELLDLLVPGAPVLLSSSSNRADRLAASYVPLPRLAAPRLLLPADNRRAATNALLLRRNGQRSAGRRFAYRLAAAGFRSGLGSRLLRDRVTVHADPDGSLVAHLATLLGRRVAVAASVGPRDPHQSRMLVALDPDGTPAAFVKVAGNELSRRLLRAEAEALRRCQRLEPAAIQAPVPLHEGCWRGRGFLVTAPLPRTRSRRPSLTVPPPLAVLDDVAATGDPVRVRLAESVYWGALRARLAAGAPRLDAWAADHLAGALANVSAVDATPLRFAGWHGDWVPWNFRRWRDRLLVWDWEYWSESAPVGFDLLHFCYGTVFFRGRGNVAAGWQQAREHALPRLAAVGVDGAAAPLVGALYLLEMLARRLDIAAFGPAADDERVFPEIYRVLGVATEQLAR